MENFDFGGPEVACGDCGSHFDLDPSGSVQGAACPACGGKRMFRAQPSPTKGEMDGDFTNQVMNMPGAAGSDSPGDPGGNPLQTGTIALSYNLHNLQYKCPECGSSAVGSEGDQFIDGLGHHWNKYNDDGIVLGNTDIPWILTSFQKCPQCGADEVEGMGCPTCGTLAPGPHGHDPLADEQTPGNPMDEGTIANDEANPYASGHGYDGYTHSHIAAYPNPHDQPEEMMVDDKASGQVMCPHCAGQGCVKCGYQGYFEPYNFGTDSQGFNTPSRIDITDSTHYPGVDVPNNFGPVRQGSAKPQINTIMDRTVSTHQRETISMEPYPSLWEEPKTAFGIGDITHGLGDAAKAIGDAATNPVVDDVGAGLGEAALAVGTGGAAVPEEIAGDAAIAGGEAAAEGGGAEAAEEGGQSLLQKGKSAIMNKLNPSNAPGGVAGYAAGKAAEGAGMEGVKDMFSGGGAGGNTGYATQPGAGQFYQYASLKSQDIPMLLTSDFETPGAVKSVDEQHDDPEKQDQKEFNDGDKSPSNLENPNNEDSGASGEDGVRDAEQGYGLGPNTPGMDHMQSLMPLIMHYINNGLTAEDDPLIQELDQMLESEDPGYRGRQDPNDDKNLELVMQKFNPKKTSSRLSLTIEPTPVTNVKQSPMPNTDITPPQDMNPYCARCGSTLLADGSCPNCGVGFSQGISDQLPSVGRVAAGQGPVTPEQFESVAQYLQTQGQGDLIPQMYEHPENFGWALNEIQKVPNTPPTVTPPPPTPAPQAPPMPGMENPQGAMPVPDMSQPGGGQGQPMQPMAKIADANNVVPRCPKCDSATTSYIDGNEANDNKNMGHCHSCQTNFKLPDNQSGLVSIAAEAFTGELGTGAPQETWSDSNGRPLVEGQVYSLYTQGMPIPDEVEVVEKKPGELGLHLVGDFNQGIGPKSTDFYVKAQDIANGKYSFEPSTNVAQDPEQAQQPDMTPGESQIGPSPTTDELQNTYPNMGTQSSVEDEPEDKDEICHKCGNVRISSVFISPTEIQHDCDRCLTSWVTHDQDADRTASIDLSWLNESNDDFFGDMERHQAMQRDTSGGSRDIRSIAQRDPRLQEVHERLEQNKMQRDAGKHFTPAEQRDLINEEGSARQYDSLDLANTHYHEVNPHRKGGNEYNVRDEDMGFF